MYAGIAKLFGRAMWSVAVVDILLLLLISYLLFRFTEPYLGRAGAAIAVMVHASWHGEIEVLLDRPTRNVSGGLRIGWLLAHDATWTVVKGKLVCSGPPAWLRVLAKIQCHCIPALSPLPALTSTRVVLTGSRPGFPSQSPGGTGWRGPLFCWRDSLLQLALYSLGSFSRALGLP